MKKIVIAAAALALAGGTQAFAGNFYGPLVEDEVLVEPEQSDDGLLLGSLGNPAVIAGVAVLLLVAVVAGNGSSSDTQ